MEYRIIKSPTPDTLELIQKRANTRIAKTGTCFDAIGLVQGRIIDMFCAADIAQKIVDVVVCDIKGSCPQNMVMLAIFGDTASVEDAITAIKEGLGERKC